MIAGSTTETGRVGRHLLGLLLAAFLLVVGSGAAFSPATAEVTSSETPPPVERVVLVHANISPTSVGTGSSLLLKCADQIGGTAALNVRSALQPGGESPVAPENWSPEGLPGSVEVQHLAPDAVESGLEQMIAGARHCDDLVAVWRAQPRTIIASLSVNDGTGDPEGNLQILIDTGYPGQTLYSPSTRMEGFVLLTDLVPTVLDSHGLAIPTSMAGRALEPRVSDGLLDHARDFGTLVQLFPLAQAGALVVWSLPAVLAMLVLLLGTVSLRVSSALTEPMKNVLRGVILALPVGIGVGQWVGAARWWRFDGGAPVAIAVIVLSLAVPSAVAIVVIFGLTRRRFTTAEPTTEGSARVWAVRTALAYLLGASLILANAAAGSPWHAAAALGPDLMVGGRFYGISNHLFGLILGFLLVSALCLILLTRSRRLRLAVIVAVAVVAQAICVAPTMGADVGSMLTLVPTLAALIMLLCVRRLRIIHGALVGLAGVLGLAGVMGVAILDYQRPISERTHLGGFIQRVVDGQLTTVISNKIQMNLEWTFSSPGMVLGLLGAAAVSLWLVAPRVMRWPVMEQWQKHNDGVRAVLLSAVVGGWIGYAVNDTGPLLVLPVIGAILTGIAIVAPQRTATASPAR